MNFIFENKKNYFYIIFITCTALHDFLHLFYSINLICISIFIIVCLNKKIILINKFSKQNRVNVLSFKIKYLDTHVSQFFKFFLVIINEFLFIYSHTWFLIYWIKYMHNFFYLNLDFLNYRNILKKYAYTSFFNKKNKNI